MKQYLESEWQKSMRVSLDYNNMMADIIGTEDGLTTEELNSFQRSIEIAHHHLTDKTGKGGFEFYNSDAKGAYRITVEGIDSNGNIGRTVYRYQLK